MPNANVQFQGQTLPIPGSYYADDVSAALPANPALIPPLIFIGYGFGGKPKTPLNFSGGVGASQLQAAMRGGPGSDFVPFIANPSPVLFGASQITYINPAPNTQSSYVLTDASGAPLINLTSADYGPPSNLLQVEVDAGTQGGIAMTLFDSYSGALSAQADNLGTPFAVAYTGTVSGATFVTTATSGTGATVFILTPGGTVSGFSFPLGGSQYATIQDLVVAVNAASIPFTARVLPNASNSQQPTSTLDAVSGGLPNPTVVGNLTTLAYVNVSGTLGGINFWVNRFGNALATSTIAVPASGNAVHVPGLIPLTHFSGATTVPPSNNDYATALGVAATIPGWVVFCDSNDPGVVALGVQHAFDVSQPEIGKPRRFVSGSSIGDTVTQAQTVARGMAIYQGTYCYPGIFATDTSSGVDTLYSGLHVAAAVASMFCGNLIAQPLTMQQLFGNGVEFALSLGAGGQIDLLQQAGVMPVFISPSTGEPTIVSDFTTWQTDNNPENIFNQQVACRQALAYSLANGLQPLVGSIASPYGITNIKNRAKSILNQLIYSPGNNGILVSWDGKSLAVVYNGSTQAASLTVNVVFVGQVRFILELVLVQPLNLSA